MNIKLVKLVMGYLDIWGQTTCTSRMRNLQRQEKFNSSAIETSHLRLYLRSSTGHLRKVLFIKLLKLNDLLLYQPSMEACKFQKEYYVD